MSIMKRLTLVLSLALIAGALMAASASAMKWSANSGPLPTLKGTLTLKKGGASPVSCTVSTNEQIAEPEPGWLEFGAGFYPYHSTTCANGLSWKWSVLFGAIEGELESGKVPLCCFHAPEGSGWGVPWSGVTYETNWFELTPETWLNGSSSTPSYIEFSEDNIGRTNTGLAVTASGKLEVGKIGTSYLYIIP